MPEDSLFLGVDPDSAWLVGRVNRHAKTPNQRWVVESSSSFVVHPPRPAGEADVPQPDRAEPPDTSSRGGIPRELRRPDADRDQEKPEDDNTKKDYWEQKGDTWIRHHVITRRCLLTPLAPRRLDSKGPNGPILIMQIVTPIWTANDQ